MFDFRIVKDDFGLPYVANVNNGQKGLEILDKMTNIKITRVLSNVCDGA